MNSRVRFCCRPPEWPQFFLSFSGYARDIRNWHCVAATLDETVIQVAYHGENRDINTHGVIATAPKVDREAKHRRDALGPAAVTPGQNNIVVMDVAARPRLATPPIPPHIRVCHLSSYGSVRSDSRLECLLVHMRNAFGAVLTGCHHVMTARSISGHGSSTSRDNASGAKCRNAIPLVGSVAPRSPSRSIRRWKCGTCGRSCQRRRSDV